MKRDNMPDWTVNQLRAEVLGIHARNPGVASNSASRNTMYSSHESQHVVMKKMAPPITLAGPEVEYSKYTTSNRFPCDARVIEVLQRYPDKLATGNSLGRNPETYVIYCNDETGEYGLLQIPRYVSYHQYFGYMNVFKDAMSRLTPGAMFAKDTVLADTPGNVGRFYTSTNNFNVALMAEAGVAEDGVIACEETLQEMAYDVIEHRTVSVGAKKFPVSTRGGKEYICIPEIGDWVDESGELLWLRDYTEGLSPVTMSRRATRSVDYTFDEPVYVRPGLRGEIIDITCIGNADTINALPAEMREQFEKYRQGGIRFYKSLLDAEKRMVRDSANRFGTKYPKIDGPLHRLLVEARALTNHPIPDSAKCKSLQLLQNRNPLDEYQITFAIRYTIVPDIGSKITGISGDKGVITSKRPRSQMPVDKDGNIADFVMAPDGTVARTNFSRGYLMYLGGAARDVTKRLYLVSDLDKRSSLEDVEMLDPGEFKKIWDMLLDYHDCINPEFAVALDKLPMSKKQLHVHECLVDGVLNFRPVDCSKLLIHAIEDLEERFPQTYGPVTHALIEPGKYVTTKDNVRIAPLQIMILDKTTDDTLVAATAAHGPFGVPAKHNQTDRYTKPWKDSPPRSLGESENRAYAAHTKSPEMVAEMVDRASNPTVQLAMVREIVNSLKPGYIEEIVDRERFPFGQTKPLELLANFLQCYGVRLKYVPEDLRYDVANQILEDIGA